MSDLGIVYVLTNPKRNMCKVGLTRSGTAEVRRQAYSREHGIVLTDIVLEIETNNVASVEAAAHRELSGYRSNIPEQREVFNVTPDHATRVVRALINPVVPLWQQEVIERQREAQQREYQRQAEARAEAKREEDRKAAAEAKAKHDAFVREAKGTVAAIAGIGVFAAACLLAIYITNVVSHRELPSSHKPSVSKAVPPPAIPASSLPKVYSIPSK